MWTGQCRQGQNQATKWCRAQNCSVFVVGFRLDRGTKGHSLFSLSNRAPQESIDFLGFRDLKARTSPKVGLPPPTNSINREIAGFFDPVSPPQEHRRHFDPEPEPEPKTGAGAGTRSETGTGTVDRNWGQEPEPEPRPGRPWIVVCLGHFEGSAPTECRRHEAPSRGELASRRFPPGHPGREATSTIPMAFESHSGVALGLP